MELKTILSALPLVAALALGATQASAEVTVPAGEPYNDYINNGQYYGSHIGAVTFGAIGSLCCSPVVGAAAGVLGADLGGWAGSELGVEIYGNDTFGSNIGSGTTFSYDPPSDVTSYGDWMPSVW